MPKRGRQKPATAPPPPEVQRDVLIGYLAGNNVTQSFQRSLLDLIGYELSGPCRLRTWAIGRTGPLGVPDTRNMLCQQVLDGPDEWLFMLDSDMGFEPDTLERLLAVADPIERPVVGGLCFAMREAGGDGMGGYNTFPSPTIFNWAEMEDGFWRFVGQDHYPVNTMIRVGATGAACILIHRRALETIGGDWFTQKLGGDGVFQGEDISFCDRLKENGIPLWIHTGIRTTHYKNLWLAESDFWNSRVADPAMQKVDVLVPTLGQRPDNIPRLLRSLKASTGLATAWYIVEPGDMETASLAAAEGAELLFEPGSFAHKVNHAYSNISTGAPWVMLVGDDVSFRPGWLDQAQTVAHRWNADVIGTNDLLNPRVMRGEHATHMMIRRSYIETKGSSWDGPGIVCHEGYGHCFVDDEIVWAAKTRAAFQMALGAYVPHWHPMGGKVADDPVYRQGAASFEDDQQIFGERLKSAVMAGAA